jgi:hypothetical protein
VDERSEILFSEIRQMLEQYKVEVPGGRRAWPVSVKERIFELNAGGIRYDEISERTGIPYTTILTWRSRNKKQEAFKELTIANVIQDQKPTVTVGKRRKYNKSPSTLTVTVGDRIKIEGLDIKSALKILEQVSGRYGDSI